MPSKKLKVALRRSIIGLSPKQEATVMALGLRRMHQTVVHEDTPNVRAMIAGLEAREAGHIVDERCDMRLIASDALEILQLERRERPTQSHLQELDVAGNRIERGAQLVRHGAEKVGLGPIGFLRTLARFLGVESRPTFRFV